MEKSKPMFKENELELTIQPAPPKKRPRKKSKATWPEEKIKEPTRGEQRDLFQYPGQQLGLEELKW